jgi:hypothetical protein
MNKHDRDNLHFLMKCPEAEFDKWMENASSDDVSYALELIKKAKSEMLLEEIELQECLELDDYAEALAVIERIKNVGKI